MGVHAEPSATLARPSDPLGALTEALRLCSDATTQAEALNQLVGHARDALDALSVTVHLRQEADDGLTTAAAAGPVGAASLEAPGPALTAPIVVRGRLCGLLAVRRPEGAADFTESERQSIRAFAALAAVVTDYDRLREKLAALAVLDERERIAKELHDGAVQSLFVVGLAAQAAAEVAGDAAAVRERLTEAVELVDRTIRDLREYIFGLDQGDPASRHLERELWELARVFGTKPGVSVDVDVDRIAAVLVVDRTPHLVQAAREALSNAVRHSGGSEVGVRLHRDGANVALEVADNGSGFDVDAVWPRARGLRNLSARAHALGGTADIESTPGAGTRIVVRVPPRAGP
ncbi:MAG TPA: histidine kinase [Mycobacteriales bacterium]|nr:histidine kinase [Mycobacteriales bacterium]